MLLINGKERAKLHNASGAEYLKILKCAIKRPPGLICGAKIAILSEKIAIFVSYFG